MFVWKDAAAEIPRSGHGFLFLSDNFLVSLKSGTTCYAFYDSAIHRWCSAETTLPFLDGEVIAWREVSDDGS